MTHPSDPTTVIDALAGDEQPITLHEWLARRHRELETMRAAAHARIDQEFDAHLRRFDLDAERMARDLYAMQQH